MWTSPLTEPQQSPVSAQSPAKPPLRRWKEWVNGSNTTEYYGYSKMLPQTRTDHMLGSNTEKDEDKFHSYISFFDKNAFFAAGK